MTARGLLREREPMAGHTTWRVGGVADRVYQPADLADLAEFVRELPPREPLHWVGLGSNLLVRDGGLRGTVIMTHGALDALERGADDTVRAEAGVPCAKLAKQALRWGLDEADFFAGIPGTVGGALAMNAGAWGGETWRWVVAVEVLDRSGRITRRQPQEFTVGYRRVAAHAAGHVAAHADDRPREEWFVVGHFRFPRANAERNRDKVRDLLARRNAAQPIGLPSGGSTFRNPPGDHAARLIEAAGLKGHRIGGAVVSEKHANFIINEGQATAADIEHLIKHVQATVEARSGVRLEPEVRIVGEERT